MTQGPQRVQRKRTAGWRKPPNTVIVTRPTKYGNPHLVKFDKRGILRRCTGPEERYDTLHWQVVSPADFRRRRPGDWFATKDEAAHEAVERFKLAGVDLLHPWDIEALRGRDLACWCPPSSPCHADVLLALANRERPKRTSLMQTPPGEPMHPDVVAWLSQPFSPSDLQRAADLLAQEGPNQ